MRHLEKLSLLRLVDEALTLGAKHERPTTREHVEQRRGDESHPIQWRPVSELGVDGV
jgi:hypothetical protein